MKRRGTREELVKCLAELGITHEDLRGCLRVNDKASAEEALEQLKRQAHKRWRQLAKDLHPDRVGESEELGARFRRLREALEWLDSQKVVAIRPRPQQTIPVHMGGIVIHVGRNPTPSTMTSSTTSTGIPWTWVQWS